MAADGSPEAGGHAVWTGSELLVWGLEDCLDDVCTPLPGARYDPSVDAWSPMAPSPLARRINTITVWTGSEIVQWGGNEVDNQFEPVFDGARYDPVGDEWSGIADAGAPRLTPLHGVWTGTEIVVLGRSAPLDEYPPTDAVAFDPDGGGWRVLSSLDETLIGTDAVWTGDRVLLHGLRAPALKPRIRVRELDPATGEWRFDDKGRSGLAPLWPRAVWTGTQLIVWGGADLLDEGDEVVRLEEGGVYDTRERRWFSTSTVAAPAARYWHAATWTGSEMLVWGGYGDDGELTDGGRFTP